MDHAIEMALEMDEKDRRGRMAELRRVVYKHNTEAWARQQLALLSPEDFGTEVA